MRRAFVVAFLLLALPLHGADYEAGIRHLAQMPMADSAIDVVSSRGFAVTGEVFWRENVSAQFAAMFVNPAAILRPEDVDLGTLGMDLYSVSLRWHVAPRRRFAPFVGGGVALVTFGNLEDRFGEDIEMEFDDETAFFAETGLRYRFYDNLYLDVAVSYMPLEATASRVRNASSVTLPTSVPLDPVTVSAGAAWRF
ncbi:MAG TPA: OmpW family outer membrane protein [Thermoanaerobaculia bacterium]|nr:OmpW family outer membrane protein [Thermoanaerobaculia bacterium]